MRKIRAQQAFCFLVFYFYSFPLLWGKVSTTAGVLQGGIGFVSDGVTQLLFASENVI